MKKYLIIRKVFVFFSVLKLVVICVIYPILDLPYQPSRETEVTGAFNEAVSASLPQGSRTVSFESVF